MAIFRNDLFLTLQKKLWRSCSKHRQVKRFKFSQTLKIILDRIFVFRSGLVQFAESYLFSTCLLVYAEPVSHLLHSAASYFLTNCLLFAFEILFLCDVFCAFCHCKQFSVKFQLANFDLSLGNV